MKKRDYTFHLLPSTSEKINVHMNAADKNSRSEFVSTAIDFYCASLDTNTGKVFLGEEVVNAMKAVVHDMEGRVLSHLRSFDINLSMLMVLFAVNLAEMTDEEIAVLRRNAVRYVDENRSAKSFVTALKERRGN